MLKQVQHDKASYLFYLSYRIHFGIYVLWIAYNKMLKQVQHDKAPAPAQIPSYTNNKWKFVVFY